MAHINERLEDSRLKWYEVVTPIVGPIKYMLRNDTSSANWIRALSATFVSTELIPYLTIKGITYLAK